jgi:hypothetical protein
MANAGKCLDLHPNSHMICLLASLAPGVGRLALFIGRWPGASNLLEGAMLQVCCASIDDVGGFVLIAAVAL